MQSVYSVHELAHPFTTLAIFLSFVEIMYIWVSTLLWLFGMYSHLVQREHLNFVVVSSA